MPGALRKDVISEMGFVLPVKMLGSPVVSTSLNQKLNTFFEALSWCSDDPCLSAFPEFSMEN